MPVSNCGRLPHYLPVVPVVMPCVLPELLEVNTPAFPPAMIQGLSDFIAGGTGLRGESTSVDTLLDPDNSKWHL